MYAQLTSNVQLWSIGLRFLVCIHRNPHTGVKALVRSSDIVDQQRAISKHSNSVTVTSGVQMHLVSQNAGAWVRVRGIENKFLVVIKINFNPFQQLKSFSLFSRKELILFWNITKYSQSTELIMLQNFWLYGQDPIISCHH